jgi:hypothetical protein
MKSRRSGGQRSEVGGQRSEVGCRMSEVGGRGSDVINSFYEVRNHGSLSL